MQESAMVLYIICVYLREHIAQNWMSFLHDDSNKTEPFRFLASSHRIRCDTWGQGIHHQNRRKCYINQCIRCVFFFSLAHKKKLISKNKVAIVICFIVLMLTNKVWRRLWCMQIILMCFSCHATTRKLVVCKIWLKIWSQQNFRYFAAHRIAAECCDDWC